jgi:hypothetical protein
MLFWFMNPQRCVYIDNIMQICPIRTNGRESALCGVTVNLSGVTTLFWRRTNVNRLNFSQE